MNKDKTCHFSCGNGFCRILSETRCDGENDKCSFYKTRKKYFEDLDNSILINRKKGNCRKCKYRETPCPLSKEV